MLFQDFVGSIIGSFIATIFSIFTWYIIEKIKKSGPKRMLRKNINKLYELFAKKELGSFKAIKVSKLIGDIGKENLLTILKLTLDEKKNETYALISGDFYIKVIFSRGLNIIDFTCKTKERNYSYEQPEENQECLESFLTFYEEQCQLEHIKLKKPKK